MLGPGLQLVYMGLGEAVAGGRYSGCASPLDCLPVGVHRDSPPPPPCKIYEPPTRSSHVRVSRNPSPAKKCHRMCQYARRETPACAKQSLSPSPVHEIKALNTNKSLVCKTGRSRSAKSIMLLVHVGCHPHERKSVREGRTPMWFKALPPAQPSQREDSHNSP